ncbi:MAG: putative transcriptional regulator similar to Bvg accessory factor [Firmicutes bacterium]|nr:putative transcriptional regulator similar to Bvg accessory factor [Bacillota bacterium]
MLLAVDVGNTVISLGIYDDRELRAEWHVSTDRRKTHDEYGLLFMDLLEHQGFPAQAVTAMAISSSVPPVIPTLEWMCQKYFKLKPLVIGPGVKTGMVIRYDNPREVGADRIVIAVAAYEKYGGPLVVVDFGTATIFDAISKDGEYLGGVIAPGVSISVEALFQHAAKLPRIELVKPKTVLARNTVHSMQSGVIYGFAGQVDAIVERLVAELGGSPAKVKVVATGDMADVLASEAPSIQAVDPYLALEGLRIIHERNQTGRGER